MSSTQQNKHIARLLVGAMSIDGTLGKEEQRKVAEILEQLHMSELIADVGAVIEEDNGDFNMYEECRDLMESLGSSADDVDPMIFRLITSVVAYDRFVSAQEAAYLSALARRLRLSSEQSKKIFKSVMAERRGRLEVAGSGVDEYIHPHLKELLSFHGAEDLVGQVDANSLEEMMHEAQEAMAAGCEYSEDDVKRALTVLGLDTTASYDEAEEVWKDTIEHLDLPKMSNLGETFVTAAINRITRINDAYKTVHQFHEHLETNKKAKTDVERLEKKIERESIPSTRDNLSDQIEKELTGVGVTSPYNDEPI